MSSGVGGWNSKAEKPKSHICDGCGKGFHSVHQLAQHSRIHTGEKPYKCSFCEKAFKQLSHLQQHTRLHTGERPYKCPSSGCSKSFIQLSNLNQHLKTHRNTALDSGSNVVCTFCARIFKTESSLLTHRCKPRKPNRPPAPGRPKTTVQVPSGIPTRSTSSEDTGSSISVFDALDAIPLDNNGSDLETTNGHVSTNGASNNNTTNNGHSSQNNKYGGSSSGHGSYQQSQNHGSKSDRSHSSEQQQQQSSCKKQTSSRSSSSKSSSQNILNSRNHTSSSQLTTQQQQQQQTLEDYANYGMNPMNGSRGSVGTAHTLTVTLNDMLGVQQNSSSTSAQSQQQPNNQMINFESNFGSSFWSCPICKLNFSSEQGFSNHFEEMRMDHRHQMEAQLFLSAMVGQQKQVTVGQMVDQRNQLSFSSSRY